jgi:16S rRNA processing protein RimM
LRPALPVTLAPRHPEEEPIDTRIERTARHRAGATLELAGVHDRDAAAELVGRVVTARREALPRAGVGEYYACDIIGLEAYSPDGARLGRIDEIISTGANDVWVVREGERELLIPAVAHAVIDVEVARGRVTVDPTAAPAGEP